MRIEKRGKDIISSVLSINQLSTHFKEKILWLQKKKQKTGEKWLQFIKIE